MNSSDGIEIVIVIIILLISGGVTLLDVQSHKKKIQSMLEGKGAKNILISWMPFDFDKSNLTYLVEYEDINGRKHNTSCKIHFWGSSIYWEEEGKE
jgi:hypothetical protein